MDFKDPEKNQELARVEKNLCSLERIRYLQESYATEITPLWYQNCAELEECKRQRPINQMYFEQIRHRREELNELRMIRWAPIQKARKELRERLYSSEGPPGHFQTLENLEETSKGLTLGRLDYELLQYKRTQQMIANGHLNQDALIGALNELKHLFTTIAHGLICDYQCLELIAGTTPQDQQDCDDISSVLLPKCRELLVSMIQRSVIFSHFPNQVLNSSLVPGYSATICCLIGIGQELICRIKGIYLLDSDSYARFLQRRRPNEKEQRRAFVKLRDHDDENAINFQQVDNHAIADIVYGVRRRHIQNVQRQKFWLYVIAEIDVPSLAISQSLAVTISLPIVIINNVSQESSVTGASTWDNEYHLLHRDLTLIPPRMPKDQFAKMLKAKFRQKIGGELNDGQIHYLIERMPRENPRSRYIRYDEFNEVIIVTERRKNGQNIHSTFWEWFYGTMTALKRANLQNLWIQGLIKGYIGEEASRSLLQPREIPNGTFILQFAERMIGALFITVKKGDRIIKIAPFSIADLERRCLSAYIRDLPEEFVFLHPNTSAASAFPVVTSPEEDSPSGFVPWHFKMCIGNDMKRVGEDLTDGGPILTPPPDDPQPKDISSKRRSTGRNTSNNRVTQTTAPTVGSIYNINESQGSSRALTFNPIQQQKNLVTTQGRPESASECLMEHSGPGDLSTSHMISNYPSQPLSEGFPQGLGNSIPCPAPNPPISVFQTHMGLQQNFNLSMDIENTQINYNQVHHPFGESSESIVLPPFQHTPMSTSKVLEDTVPRNSFKMPPQCSCPPQGAADSKEISVGSLVEISLSADSALSWEEMSFEFQRYAWEQP